jgi:putative nucleotidyltransferase with HDIG domain
MDAPDQPTEGRWRPRPLLSFALRATSVLVPAAAGVATAFGFVHLVPMPTGLALIPWCLGLVAISTVATAIAEHLGKRFLPLAVLFRLSLVFPDRAPSRFVMARGAGNVRQLELRIKEARDRGVDPEPARAAEQILALVAALSAHDRKTRGHSERVRAFTDLVAGQLKLSSEDRDRLRWAALLHDIGKIRVPARILNKPGRPDAREWEQLQAHPAIGARIAEPLLPWLGPWGHAIEQHHERFGGGGYPDGLEGDRISFAARIVAVADSFEVMTAARSYKKPMSVPAARRELAACAGEQFDPAIVRAFLNVSLGRLWWIVGPVSWTGLAPILGPVQRASGQLAGAATGATAAAAVAVAGLLPVLTGTGGASVDLVPTRAAAQAIPTPAGDGSADDQVRTGGPGTTAAGDGAGQHGGVPGSRQGADEGTDPPDEGGAGGSGGGGTSIGGVVNDPVGTLGGVVDESTQTVDGVVDGAAETVSGVVDGATDAVDGLLGGSAASDLMDEPVEDLGGLLGGLFGS